MRKLKKPKFVTMAIFTTITIIFWVFFGVYRILTTDVDSNIPTSILNPLNPTLDTQTLESLGDRIYFKEEEIVGLPTQKPEMIIGIDDISLEDVEEILELPEEVLESESLEMEVIVEPTEVESQIREEG